MSGGGYNDYNPYDGYDNSYQQQDGQGQGAYNNYNGDYGDYGDETYQNYGGKSEYAKAQDPFAASGVAGDPFDSPAPQDSMIGEDPNKDRMQSEVQPQSDQFDHLETNDKQKSGTVASAMDFNKEEDKEQDAAFSNAVAKSKDDSNAPPTRRETLSATIKCNDGIMQIEILGQEKKGAGLDKHIAYRIKGKDSLGDIDVIRRYKEFTIFRDLLFVRYPGIFIPPLPPKQATGNHQDLFIQERQFFLNEFLKKLCSYTYLAGTPEVQVFLRPPGRVEDAIKSIHRTNTDMLLEFFKARIVVSDYNINETRVSKYNQDIHAFVKDQKVIMDHLKNFKAHINQIVPMKYNELRYYKQFADFLVKFEEGSQKELDAKAPKAEELGIPQVKLISGDTKAHLRNKLDELAEQLTNPFVHIRNWVKSEMFNLGALIAAIGEKESCDHRKQQTIKKLAEERELCEKLNQNKFSVKTFFKSASGKDKKKMEILANIQQRERDIANWDEIKRFLTVYLAEIAIPDFKKRKMFKYIHAMQNFSKDELSNAEKHQSCWKDFYDLTKAYQPGQQRKAQQEQQQEERKQE